MKMLTKMIPGRTVEPSQTFVRFAPNNLIQVAFPTECFDPADFDGKPYTSFKLTPEAAAALAETLQSVATRTTLEGEEGR